MDERGRPKYLDIDLKFEIPPGTGRRVYLVSQALKPFAGEPHVLVWLDDWSVWPSGQRMHVFDRFRMSYGETRQLIDSPGHLFDRTEIEDAISFVTIAALFLWDCYVVSPGQSRLLYLSHDEYGVSKGLDLQRAVPWLTAQPKG